MTRAHTRDLSTARPRGCGSIRSIKPIAPQYTPEQVELFKKLVSAQDGEVFTTSRQVAELFEKEHRNVLRAIRLLDCDEEFTALNYELTDFIDKNGDSRPEYLISKDGMVFLVMGFTGKKAAQFKLLYIRAFNWMMEQLQEDQELQHLLHDFARREALSASKGSFHGQGLAQRRIEKRALGLEQAQLKVRAQLSLELTGEGAA
ncbi:Rha family transcriptional regulator [Aeromonas hydrophila]|uniref:Rha family transcriptional regulator n=1 Tax=Aeromonas hydrophila TaxID=644 RepID=UPI001A8D105C|nr:Rha family transcriptional regulator [Aeromonas hydrophila]QSR51720.1 Rha family transcriptional regulator [Aeromonas hydrophila]QSR77173.1 Rha family transcriptional regulator [Aeromonas hydrophila]QSR81364.1 Rha family transcriptional regulator [Aeromonas hydrophila]UMQ35806.1 Rha family transcriptional regulator [Aeromonas hydrophila]UMQ44340.1 Rha family transcriptional regulator [Aeromonas hydrophila]